jgi:hypothetical protein
MRRIMAIMATALAVGGCSSGADRAAAEAGVAQFHQMIEAQRYHDIFVGAADEFRGATSEAEGVRFLQMVHDRLGPVRSTTPSGWRVNFTPGGSTVSLNYDTQFASAAGTENFVFRIGGANARLVGYHVNSPALAGSGGPGNSTQPKPEAGGPPSPPPAQSQVAPLQPPKPPEPPQPGGGK